MANKFVTFLEHVGTDIEHGIDKALAFVKPLEPFIDLGLASFVPGGAVIAPIFNHVVQAAVLAQQAYQAPGSGPKRLAAVVGILGPTIGGYLNTKDQAVIEKYVASIVALLNLAPAPTA